VKDGPSATEALLAGLAGEGVHLIRFGSDRVRAVFHRDVDDNGLERAVSALRRWSASRG